MSNAEDITKNPQFEFRVTGSFGELVESESDWDLLLTESYANTVFLTLPWLHSWEQTYGQNTEIIVVQLWLSGRLIAAAGFENRAGVLLFAGEGPSDYSDFIISDELNRETAAQALDFILCQARKFASKYKHFKLGRIPADSQSFKLLRSSLCSYSMIFIDTVSAPRMDMEVVEEKLRKKSLVRHEKKLQKKGELVGEIYTSSEQILPLLNPFFEQHIDRWSNTPYPSLFNANEDREFYRLITERLNGYGCLRFFVLYLDGEMVAAHYGFVYAGCYIWYKPSFKSALSKFSPGEVLLKRLLESSRVEPVQTFDFTIGNEAFKLRFATSVPMASYIVVTDSIVSNAFFQLKQILKKLFGRFTKQLSQLRSKR